MSGLLTAALSRRTLIGVAVVAAALFLLSGLIAAVYGNPPSNDAIDLIGSIAWFGWMVAVLVLVVLSAVAIVRHAAATRREAKA